MTKPKTTPARKRGPAAAPPRPARCTAVIPNFDDLPDSALVRQAQLVRSAKHPTRPAPLPFSPATLWRLLAAGSFPKPVRMKSGRITAWRVGDVRAWLANQTGGQ
ncbi:helix-turn-helix transcriptional regulator [Ottowia sp.]|uniref:helix-turn-helix transcriptional regulator n=1 Tax=Ottowia sp. TaxID=1898956 RepID=UPI0039E3DFD9